MKKSRKFWESISLSQRESSSVPLSSTPSSLSPCLPRGPISGYGYSNMYFGTGFSSSCGLYVFMGGRRHHHWPTVDNESADVSDRCALAPYYDLCLQDMNWTIVPSATTKAKIKLFCTNVDISETDSITNIDAHTERATGKFSNEIIPSVDDDDDSHAGNTCIQLCDDFGWEGTGCLKFNHQLEYPAANSDSLPLSGMAVEIPLSQHLPLLRPPETEATRQSLVVKTTECRGGQRKSVTEAEANANANAEGEASLRIDILCHLIPARTEIQSDPPDSVTSPDFAAAVPCERHKTSVQITFSFQYSPVLKEMEIQFSDDADSVNQQCVTIQCNKYFKKPLMTACVQQQNLLGSGKDDTDMVWEWEDCSYVIPSMHEYLPSIRSHFGLDESVLFELLVKKASICLAHVPASASASVGADLPASVYLGTFSILHGGTNGGDDVDVDGDGGDFANIKAVVPQDASSSSPRQLQTQIMNINVENVSLTDEVKHCVTTQRLGATIEWTALSLSNAALEDMKYLQEGVSILSIRDSSLAAVYLQKMIQSCGISPDQFYNNNNKNRITCFYLNAGEVSASVSASSEESHSLTLEAASTPLGSTRSNSFRLNLLPSYSHTWAIDRQDANSHNGVSESRLEIIYYILFLQPFSFACTRPALTDCPVVLLCT